MKLPVELAAEEIVREIRNIGDRHKLNYQALRRALTRATVSLEIQQQEVETGECHSEVFIPYVPAPGGDGFQTETCS